MSDSIPAVPVAHDSGSTATPLRRRGLLATVGAAAALAGIGAAWWRFRAGDVGDAGGEGADAAALWALQCETPSGTPLALQSMRGRPLLVNFWATWCPPCIEELPLVDGFYRQHAAKGWQVIGLAIDQPAAVRGFLAKHPLTFPVGVVGMAGTELLMSLGNVSGSLPFSVLLRADGLVQHRKMGRLEASELAAWAPQA